MNSFQFWAWVNFKAAVGFVLPLSVLLNMPDALNGRLGPALLLWWAGLTIGGTVISLSGLTMFMHRHRHPKAGTIGLSVELAGLAFMLAGPLVLLLAYVWLAVTDSPRWVAIGFLWGLCATILVRFTQVYPRYRAEASDQSKEV